MLVNHFITMFGGHLNSSNKHPTH